jgi:uncharacterized protein (DUF4415 family)
VFRKATAKPAPALPKKAILPNARETVTLRIDSYVLAHFQQDGAGWQERINAALRQVVGPPPDQDAAIAVEDLNASNDK